MEPENNYSEDKVRKILESYKKKAGKDKERYARNKESPEFMEQNRVRAREHYENNKEKKKDAYLNNKETRKAKCLMNYYKKQDRLEEFKEKHPACWDLIK